MLAGGYGDQGRKMELGASGVPMGGCGKKISREPGHCGGLGGTSQKRKLGEEVLNSMFLI